MSNYKVGWVKLNSGTVIPAQKAVCPVCEDLDIKTRFDTTVEPAVAQCSKGHEWTFKIEADA